MEYQQSLTIDLEGSTTVDYCFFAKSPEGIGGLPRFSVASHVAAKRHERRGARQPRLIG